MGSQVAAVRLGSQHVARLRQHFAAHAKLDAFHAIRQA
jgi:hypothetical protein